MTTKELAKDLKEHIGCGIEVPLYDEELEVVVEALEKQIAKKVIKQSTDEKTHYKCNCGYIFKTVYNDGTTQTHLNIGNYCHKCGQKLEWSDKDE